MRAFFSAILQMLGLMTASILVIALSLFGVASLQFYRDTNTYPLLSHDNSAVMSMVYGRDNQVIAEFARQRRIFTPITEIPPLLVSAMLSAEDKKFFQHFGLDVARIARASAYNIGAWIKGERLHGASTITQQIAKQFTPTDEIGFARKAKEALIALQLEEKYSKTELLEFYLNEIYLGRGSYGVTAAALDYFGKPLKRLSLSELAFLAALPKAPNNYHPVLFPQRALSRRNWVLERMMWNGYISREQALEAQKQAITLRSSKAELGADYYVEHVRRWAQARYGESTYAGGLHIHTSLHPQWQQLAHRSLQEGLSEYDRRHGYRGPVARMPAMVQNNGTGWVIRLPELPENDKSGLWQLAVVLGVDGTGLRVGLVDASGARTGRIPHTSLRWALEGKPIGEQFSAGDVVWVRAQKKGIYALRQWPQANGALVMLSVKSGEVLAMTGGMSFADSQFNRATQAKRQAGSAFKPIVYAAALESGYTPASQFLDAPFVLPKSQIGFWKPENYDKSFFGKASLRLGLEASRNLMTIRVAQALGMRKVARYSRAFGVADNLPAVLPSALGAGETSLLRLTNAYAVFASGGQESHPSFVRHIRNKDGTTLYARAQQAQRKVVSAQTAYQITSILQGAITRGTGRRLAGLGVPLAGKTGTSNQNRDAWFIVYTPDFVIGCFVGHDTPQSLGGEESGASVALPITERFLRGLRLPKRDFAVPEGIEFVRVNFQTGQPTSAQKGAVREAFKRGNAPAHHTHAPVQSRPRPDFSGLY